MLWLLFHLLMAVWADIYMHNPRGSNNRLGETNNDQTANENRLFDSQNNNNGGYVWGPPMYFIEGSILPIEWTNQHSCGGGEGKASCNIVIQYMCSRFLRDGATPPNAAAQPGTPETIPFTPGDPTDGQFESVQLEQNPGDDCDDDNDAAANNQQFCYKERKRIRAPLAALMNGQPDGFNGPAGFPYGNNGWDEYTEFEYGMHESWSNYQKCYYRERNKGLFIADENPGETAVETRQEDNGRNNRHGYECTEERDYYPYWHPSEWVDVAVLTDDLSLCSYFRSESFNSKAKHECIMEGWAGTDAAHPEFRTPIGSDATPAQIPNNERACDKAGGRWVKVHSHDVAPPECLPTPFTRDNHLGNSWSSFGAYAPMYNWTLNVPERMLWSDASPKYCALRIRYNISTSDYEGWGSDRVNAVPVADSPITNNPRKSYGSPYDGYWDESTFDSAGDARGTDMKLRLALNSDQYGRTFQDRSHMFRILKRPAEIADSAVIWNLNVRGKRGNIVQAYPGVEYDFVPNHLPASVGDYIHFQWTGGDSHPNNGNNNAEGRDNTDRSNLVILSKNRLGNNYPNQQFGDDIDLFSDDKGKAFRMAIRFAHQDQRNCRDPADVNANSDNDEQNCEKLNRAARYFDGADELRNGGLYAENLVKLRDVNGGRVYHFFSSRNNNFSNRGQKGVIEVGQGQALPRWLIVIIGAVTIVGTILLVVPMVMFAPTAITAIGSSLAQRL